MWQDLLLFSLLGLKQPDKEKGKKRNLTTVVKNNLSRPQLNGPASEQRTKNKPSSDSVLKKIVEGKINDADISDALRVLSSEDSVATPSTEVLDILRGKHPAEIPDAIYPDPPDWSALPSDVSVEEVLAAVQSFPNGYAGRIDGLRPQDLEDMLNQSIGAAFSSLADASAKLVTLIIYDWQAIENGFCHPFGTYL